MGAADSTTVQEQLSKLSLHAAPGSAAILSDSVKHMHEVSKLSHEQITAEIVKKLGAPTEKFLCRLTDNWPKLRFGGFKIRDLVSGYTLVEVQDDEVDNGDTGTLSDEDDPSTRVIKYHLGPDFLRLRTVGLTLTFSNGP